MWQVPSSKYSSRHIVTAIPLKQYIVYYKYQHFILYFYFENINSAYNLGLKNVTSIASNTRVRLQYKHLRKRADFVRSLFP